MAKTTPKAKAGTKAKTKAATEAPAAPVATRATKAKKAPKKVSAPAAEEPKEEPAKPAKRGKAPKTETKAPVRAPTSDSQLVIHGLAEVVRLGLSAMDPEARAALIAALVKVGGSLAKTA